VDHTERSIRHLAFFEVLAEMDEAQAEWRATSAGLLVLRLFDAWTDEGPTVAASDAWGMRAVREAVALVDAGTPVRRILQGIVDAMERAREVDIAAVAPRLMAYGRALDYEGRWQLAADVFRTLVEHAHPIEDADLAADANMQLGYCARMLGDPAEAASSYRRAGEVARRAGDIVKVLRATIGDAKVALDKGNFPGAESILDDAIGAAERHGLTEVRATALHDRADVAIRRGDFALAIRLGYEALRGTSSPAARDRVLGDLAGAFHELGVRSAARDAYLLLAATAQEQYVRWTSTVNLMEIAMLDRCEPVFEQYRRELADADLPPMVEAYFHLYVGRGYETFGHLALARDAYERALALATRHSFHKVAFDVEAGLAGLGRKRSAAAAPEAQAPEPVREVARAITRMRAAAGVG
jgi:tetratricopeptide (TPR) repeat protein